MSFLKNHPFAVEAFFESSLVLSYAVPKEELIKLIPSCLEPDTFNDTWGFLAVAIDCELATKIDTKTCNQVEALLWIVHKGHRNKHSVLPCVSKRLVLHYLLRMIHIRSANFN